jgi:siroheme decarboxylase
MSERRFRLLNEFQRGFPLVPEPFAAVGRDLGVEPESVMEDLAQLQGEGAVSRLGAVFRPGALGAGVLAAMAVPAGRLVDVGEQIGRHAEVNHNYEREHAFNLWFVATCADSGRLAAVLAQIAQETGLEVMALPLVEEYHIDLGFDLAGGETPGRGANGGLVQAAALSPSDRCLIGALQDGLPLVARPYQAVGERCAMSEAEVIERLAAWQASGIVRRFGVVVRHLELGYRANAMVVWNVPDELAGGFGARLAREADVSLCYRRERHLPHWPYNLYAMIHGKERAVVSNRIDAISRELGLDAFAREILYSRRRFKQTGARYVDQPEGVHGCA